MSLVYAKKSDEIGMCFMCASRVSTCSVVYVACGIEILDVLDIKIRVATLVRESTYIRNSHGSRRRSAFLIEDGFTVWRDSERCSWGLARYLPRRKSWRKF